MKVKEYKGERIAAGLTARLVPPSAQYPDTICKLILTERHLYILEDNCNGTYKTLFIYFIERVQDMEAQLKGVKYKRSALYEMWTDGCAALIEGFTSPGRKKKEEGVRLVITYDDGSGRYNRLYFRDLQSNSNRFIRAYHKQKELLNQ